MTHFAQVPNCEHTHVPHYHYFNEAGVFVNCPFAAKPATAQHTQTANQIRNSIDKRCLSVEEQLADKWISMTDESLNKGWTTSNVSSAYITYVLNGHDPRLERPSKRLQKKPKKAKKDKATKQTLPVLQRLLTFDSSKVKHCDVCTKMHFGFSKTCPYCGF